MISLQTDDIIKKNSQYKNSKKKYCRVCKKEMKQIPIRKIDSLIIIEQYCPSCDKSIMRYEKIQVI